MLGQTSTLRTILAAAAVAGALDLIFAICLAGWRGAEVDAVPRYVASGLVGDMATTASWAPLAGIVSHFIIMIVAVGVFFLIAHEPPFNRASWWFLGGAFGVAMYAAMNLVVVPLSMAKVGTPSMALRLADLISHIVLVGLVSGIFLKRPLEAARRQPAS